MGFIRPWVLSLMALIPAYLIVSRRQLFHKTPWTSAAWLRLSALILAIVAAAGPEARLPSDRVERVFVLDVSDSIGQAGVDLGLSTANALLSGMQGDDHAALVLVGSSAMVDTPMRPGNASFRRSAMVETSTSNLSEGIYRALSLYRRGDRQLVLLTDGRWTGDDPSDAIELAVGMGVQVDVVPLGTADQGDVSIRETVVPSHVREGEIHSLDVLLESDYSSRARLLVFRDGEYIGEESLSLRAGETRVQFSLPEALKGTTVYEVLVDAEGDINLGNNRGLAATQVLGPPRLLYVSSNSPSGSLLMALEVQGLDVVSIGPGEIPDSLEALSSWDSLILDNVSSYEISLLTMDVLETWVRTRGGGLMMIGGDASFGLGGYRRTPIEEALPVDMDAPSSLYIPSLAMVMVIDKSGSMGGDTASGKSKLDLVKEAVLGAVEVLNPLYTVGLIAFDADFNWAIPPTDAGNRQDIVSGLEALNPGGGTILYPAMLEAYQRLAEASASVRHLVVLSDGLAPQAEYETLVDAMSRDGITVSTVAIGDDADRELLDMMAQRGGGRSWYAADADMVPRIFASESMIVSKGLVVEETVFPQVRGSAEALDGLELNFMPPLHGYVMTYAKTSAVEALVSPRGHPLLSFRSHGLGRTVAFSSDLRGQWGRDWMTWEAFPRFIAQVVRWMQTPTNSGNTALSVSNTGSTARVVIESRDDDGRFRNGLDFTASVSTPSSQERNLHFRPIAPGRYEATFTLDSDGLYWISAVEEAGLRVEGSVVRPYSPELQASGIDAPALTEFTRVGGGSILDGSIDPEIFWQVRDETFRERKDLGFWTALLVLLLVIADIGFRQIREGGPRQRTSTDGEPQTDYQTLILQGLDKERNRPKHAASYWFGKERRPSAAEAARFLAERRNRKP